jgi:hypothetical protein
LSRHLPLHKKGTTRGSISLSYYTLNSHFKRISQSTRLVCLFYEKSASVAGCTHFVFVLTHSLCHQLNDIDRKRGRTFLLGN